MPNKVGFIGLGNMGAPMAKNILCESGSLFIWDKDERKCQDFLTEGVSIAEISSLAELTDIIFLSLPGPKEVKEIITSEEGLISKGRPGQYIIDLSSIDPITSKEMAEFAKNKGIIYIDAPVSGGVPKAIDATLTLIVGAAEEEVEEVLPYLKAFTTTIHYIGQIGGGTALKVINNFMAACNQFTLAEGILMADNLNIPFETFYNVVSTSSGASQILSSKRPKIENNQYEPGFTVDLMLKDLELAIQLCKDIGISNFSANLTQQWYRIAQLRGLGTKDMSIITNLLREIEPLNSKRLLDFKGV